MDRHELADFTDLYDVPPPEIELVGGPRDGERMVVPDDRRIWLFHAPPDLATLYETVSTPLQPILPQVLVYRWAGRIRDDGTRVFQLEH